MDPFLAPQELEELRSSGRKPEGNAIIAIPTADDIAAILGIVPCWLDSLKMREGYRFNVMSGMLEHVRTHAPEEGEPIMAEFAAKYLPAVVEKFLCLPSLEEYSKEARIELGLCNAYFRAICFVQHTQFFYKFMRSKQPIAQGNKKLVATLAERLLAFAPICDKYLDHPRAGSHVRYKELLTNTVITLNVFLSTCAKDDNLTKLVPPKTRVGLDRWLKRWTARYSSLDILGMYSTSVSRVLSGDKWFIDQALMPFRRKIKGWEACGMHGCEKKARLKACARCQTIQYCSTAHQKAHWNYSLNLGYVGKHKMYCFETAY